MGNSFFDKLSEKEAWGMVYKGHVIKVINSGKMTLYIDGKEAAKQKAMLNINIMLSADIPDTDEYVIFYYSGEDCVGGKVQMFIGKKSEFVHGVVQKDGTFKGLTAEDDEKLQQEENEALIMSQVLDIIP